MEIAYPYPNFLPIEASAHLYSKWDCQVVSKQHQGIYYKCLEGNGFIQMINGNKYQGNFYNGMFHGEGKFSWNSGIAYTGTFIHNQLTGEGKFQWPDGSIYEGNVQAGYRQGFGKFISLKENYAYEGYWLKGLKEGKGKITYGNGKSSFEGEFHKDLKHGTGKMIYESQNQYEGNWKQNKKDGFGTMNWVDIHEKYVGEWSNDQPDGYGEYFWFQNKVQFKLLKNIYKGQWKNGKRNGLGVFFHSNGCKFQGFYKDNFKEGLGISHDQNGFAKIENYKQDKPLSLLNRSIKKLARPEKAPSSIHDISILSNENSKLAKVSIGSNSVIKNQKVTETNENKEQKASSSMNQGNNITVNSIDNQYRRYIDFEHPEVNQNFHNFLLRLNTRLRNLYKAFCQSSFQVKDFYTGMTLENYWKVLKDSKILGENLNLIKVSKQFSKGSRSFFEFSPPDQKVFHALENHQNILDEKDPNRVLWNAHCKQIRETAVDWDNLCLQQEIFFHPPQSKDISKPSQVILFRHFVCLIVHTGSISASQSESLKAKVENVISTIEISLDNLRAIAEKQKTNDNNTQNSHPRSITVPEWVKPIHDSLIKILCPPIPDIMGRLQVSVPFRVLYSALEQNGLFKDSTQKMMSLERMEKYLNVKNSFIKKQWKNYFQDLEKIIKDNPSFEYLMNYQMNPKEIHQFLYLNISRKAVSNSAEELKMKYGTIIQQLIDYSKNIMNVTSQARKTLARKPIKTDKDTKREKKISQREELRRRMAEEKRKKEEEERQEMENKMMGRQDKDVQSLQVSSNFSSENYV